VSTHLYFSTATMLHLRKEDDPFEGGDIFAGRMLVSDDGRATIGEPMGEHAAAFRDFRRSEGKLFIGDINISVAIAILFQI
jgi:hypothetical protein